MGNKCAKEPNDNKTEDILESEQNQGMYGVRLNGQQVASQNISRSEKHLSVNNRSKNNDINRSRFYDRYDVREHRNDLLSNYGSDYNNISVHRSRNKKRNFYDDDFIEEPNLSVLLQSHSARNEDKNFYSNPSKKKRIFSNNVFDSKMDRNYSQNKKKVETEDREGKTTNIFFEDSRKAIVTPDKDLSLEEEGNTSNQEDIMRTPKRTNFQDYLTEEKENPISNRKISPFDDKLLTPRQERKHADQENKSGIRVIMKGSLKELKVESPINTKQVSEEEDKKKIIKRRSTMLSKLDNKNTEFYRRSNYRAYYDMDLDDSKINVVNESLPDIQEEETSNLFENIKDEYITLSNGSRYIGEVKNNLPNGKGEEYFNQGDIYKGSFVNGKKEGYGIFEKRNKFIYEGYFKNDKYEGKGKIYYLNGNVFDGMFKNNKEDGTGILKEWEGTIIKKGLWLDGEYHGTKF